MSKGTLALLPVLVFGYAVVLCANGLTIATQPNGAHGLDIFDFLAIRSILRFFNDHAFVAVVTAITVLVFYFLLVQSYLEEPEYPLTPQRALPPLTPQRALPPPTSLPRVNRTPMLAQDETRAIARPLVQRTPKPSLYETPTTAKQNQTPPPVLVTKTLTSLAWSNSRFC